MKKLLFVVQTDANIESFSQALDAALVAAIFGKKPSLLFLCTRQEIDQFTAQALDLEKFQQLIALQAELIYSENSAPSKIQQHFSDADFVLTY